MLSGPHQKFCNGIVSGLNATEAYAAAYPRAKRDACRKHAARLMTNGGIKAEIARQRAAAEKLAGSSVMTMIEKRQFFARIARAAPSELPMNSDLWQSIKHTKDGTECRLPDKLGAMKLDNDLEGVGAEAEANKAVTVVIRRLWDDD